MENSSKSSQGKQSLVHSGSRGGTVQPHKHRDVFFAGLFLVQLYMIIMIAAYVVGGPYSVPGSSKNEEEIATSQQINDDDNDSNSLFAVNVPYILYLLTVSFVSAMTAIIACFFVMAQNSNAIVQFSFCSAPASAILAALWWTYSVGEFQKGVWYSATGTVAASALLYLFARRYISYAASNLHVAMEALDDHRGLFGLAVASMVLTYVWVVVWSVAVLGLVQYYSEQEEEQQRLVVTRQEPCTDDPSRLCTVKDYRPLYVMAAMVMSFFWTSQVLQNIVYTTTAGTVGAWWSSGGGGTELRGALSRSCTFSLGSICLGSLIVAVLQTLEWVVQTLESIVEKETRRQEQKEEGGNGAVRTRRRKNSDNKDKKKGILNWLRKIEEYVNAWAFVYVGVYGYAFFKAGRMVASILLRPGWSTFVSDGLVSRVLNLAKVSIALLSGALTTMVMSVTAAGYNENISLFLVFLVGGVLGYLLSNIALFVVESAVRTIIVCFAEKPLDLNHHRPQLYQELQEGWSQAYPKAWEARPTSHSHAHQE